MALVVFSHHLPLQPLLPRTRSQQSDHLATLNILATIVVVLLHGIYSLQIANSLKNFNQAVSTRCSIDNKEKLSANIRREYASDFCHDRKSAFTWLIRMSVAPWHRYFPRPAILQVTSGISKMLLSQFCICVQIFCAILQ